MSIKWIIGSVLGILVFIIGSYVLLAAGGSKQKVHVLSYTSADTKKPSVEVASTSKDLGSMKVSDEKEASFIVKNTGIKMLQLFDISSSCMCTAGQVIVNGRASEEFGMHSTSEYVANIASGQQATVKVIYRPYLMPVYGAIEREVYVGTNDPANPKLVFKITAHVQ